LLYVKRLDGKVHVYSYHSKEGRDGPLMKLALSTPEGPLTYVEMIGALQTAKRFESTKVAEGGGSSDPPNFSRSPKIGR